MVLGENSEGLIQVLAGSSTRDGSSYSPLREEGLVSKPHPHAPVSFYSLAGLLVVTDEEALLAFKGGRPGDMTSEC